MLGRGQHLGDVGQALLHPDCGGILEYAVNLLLAGSRTPDQGRRQGNAQKRFDFHNRISYKSMFVKSTFPAITSS